MTKMDWWTANEGLIYAKPLPRWRMLLARWLLTGTPRLSECSKHYDEYGMPNTNISGCIWCILDSYEAEFKRLSRAAETQTKSLSEEGK